MLHRGVVSIFLPLPQILMKMKRKLAYAAGLLLIACTFTACDMLGDNCEICQLVSYDNGNPYRVGHSETEFCDDELFKIKTNTARDLRWHNHQVGVQLISLLRSLSTTY